MYIFTYYNNEIPKLYIRRGLQIFKFGADSILTADEAYKKKLNQDPRKQPYVGCEIIRTHKIKRDVHD